MGSKHQIKSNFQQLIDVLDKVLGHIQIHPSFGTGFTQKKHEIENYSEAIENLKVSVYLTI